MRRALAAAAAPAAAVVAAAATGGCGTTPTPPAAAPIATAVSTADGQWATLALGRLNDRVNTFWQLLERPAGSTAWSVQTTGTETATNGGVLLAVGADRHLIAALPPTQLLGFTPVVTVAGAVFTSAGPAPPLAAAASALAAGGRGEVAVAAGGGRLLSHTIDDSGWRPVATAAVIGRGSPCGPPVLDAVAVTPAGLVAGGSCAAPGRVGLWSSSGAPGAAWQLAPVTLPNALRHDRTNVLYLDPSGTGLVSAGRDVVAIDGGATSHPLPAGTVDAVSATPAGGLCVVVGAPTTPQIDVWTPGQSAWSALPVAPAGTAVAFVDGDTATALAATPVGRPATITVYTLAPGTSTWQRGQVLAVTVPYGSSG